MSMHEVPMLEWDNMRIPYDYSEQARFLADQVSGLLVLEDIGPENRSITNDAERVVERLGRDFHLRNADGGWKRVVYRECGYDDWTGMAIHDGKFAGFVILSGVHSRKDAIKAARAATDWGRHVDA